MSVDRMPKGEITIIKKQILRCALILMSLLVVTGSSLTATAAQPSPVEPMYVGLSRMKPELSISTTGTISCSDRVKLYTGYSANVTWELQSGTGTQLTTISTWKDSGTFELTLNATRQAVRGNNYRLKTSVKVYNSSGTLVDDEVKYSNIVSY